VKAFLEIVRGPRFGTVRDQMRADTPGAFAELEGLEFQLRATASAHRLTEPLDAETGPRIERVLSLIKRAGSPEDDEAADVSAAVVSAGVRERRTAARGALAGATA